MIWLISQAWGLYQPTWEELYPEEGWAPKDLIASDVGNISIFEKQIDGMPCFQARANTDILPALILEIAADAESALNWSSAGLLEGETLLRRDNYVDYYQYLKLPIISDRFWILRGYFETFDHHGKKAEVFRWHPISELYSSKLQHVQKRHSGAIEAQTNIGAWMVLSDGSQRKAQTFELRYYICTHPGGYIPSSLQSIGTEHTLPNNVEEIIHEARQSVIEGLGSFS